MKWLLMPLGARSAAPSDGLTKRAARLLLEPSETRDRLTEGVCLSRDKQDPAGMMDLALEAVLAAEPVEQKIYELTGNRVAPHNVDRVLKRAVETGAVDRLEARVVRHAMEMTKKAISVDEIETVRLSNEIGIGRS